MQDELFNELLESVKEAARIIRGEAEPSRVFHLAPGEVYRNLYAAMPADRGVNEWTEAECKQIRRLLKPCFNGQRGWKAEFQNMIEARLNELRKLKKEE